jgi:DNA-binding NtrC family response regulator
MLLYMKNVLVVDDDKDLCDLICEIVKEEGFNVCKAYNGFIALEKMDKCNFDLLIIDNRLTGLSGISVVERTNKSKPLLKTIMISAFGNSNTKNLALALGVSHFIDKPFDIKQLIQTIKDTLSCDKSLIPGFIF